MIAEKKASVVFCAGMGDGLQLIPLWKSLQKQGFKITLFLETPYFPYDFAQSLELFDKIIEIHKNKTLIKSVFRYFSHFDVTFLDYYSSGPKQSVFACLTSKKVIINRRKWYLKILPKLVYKKPMEEGHNILQNLSLYEFKAKTLSDINYITYFKTDRSCHPDVQQLIKSTPYIVAQISAANNLANYKNWQVEKWEWLFQKIKEKYPKLKIVLIGDKNEVRICQKIVDTEKAGILSFAGKTNLHDLTLLLKHSKMYLGLDSGPMHLASMLGTPTLTLWGPSDPMTIGYEAFSPRLHKDICLWVDCHPCLSFIRPNSSLVKHPSLCPHPRCIKEIKREEVWITFEAHWKNIYGKEMTKK